MSTVKFATLCDSCGKRSVEYSSWPSCRECLTDICPSCAVVGSLLEDDGRSTVRCLNCEALENAEFEEMGGRR